MLIDRLIKSEVSMAIETLTSGGNFLLISGRAFLILLAILTVFSPDCFWIIKTMTDRFPHWFRSVCETIYGRLIFNSDAWKLKEFMGLRRLDSTTPYVQGSWEEDEEKIFKL